jgi:hypothetical protein
VKSRMFFCRSIQFDIHPLYDLGRPKEGTRREMVEGKGVVLKGGVQIGLGQMPGVIRLCKEAEICEFKFADQLTLFPEGRPFRLLPVISMGKQEAQEQNLNPQAEQKYLVSSHRQSSPLTLSRVISWNLSNIFPLWSFRNSLASASLPNGMSSLPMGP